MQSVEARRTALKENAMTNISDSRLSNILDYFLTEKVHHFVCNEIDEMDSRSINSAYFHCLSINNVLHNDLVQHILSFGGYSHNRTVCKGWNELNIRNEGNILSAIYDSVEDKYPETKNPEMDTWIMHKKRRYLNPVEIRRGFKGPLRQILKDVKRCCKAGDRIFVHGGTYHHPRRYPFDLHFVGISRRSTLSLSGTDPWSHYISFRNLNVVTNTQGGTISSQNWESSGSIEFKNCTVSLDSSIYVEDGGTLIIENCNFSSSNYGGGSVIWATNGANKISVVDSTFNGFKKCLEVVTCTKSNVVRVLMTNNVLRNNEMGIMALEKEIFGSQVRTTTAEKCDRYILKGNRNVTLRRGADSPVHEFDPNIFYRQE